ncbi:MAG: wax ester/triacylglycerol synthase family O-acyltransferase [Halomonadaceae bacterium]|nr:MAG: wax ester/triacylglycerol synthase family O-acyltransferase [Halomonadaceae bacterium]
MSDRPELMTAVDTAWWHMERDDNPMMITGVLVLDRQVNLEHFRKLLEERLLCYNRFSQRVVEHDGRAFWEADPHFSLENHLHHIALPDPGDQEALEELVADLASTPLDVRHPLWQFHLVDHYRGGAALVARLHHCIADGLALVQVLMSLTDEGQVAQPQSHPHKAENLVQSLIGSVGQLARQGMHLGHELLEEGMAVARHPEHIKHWLKEGQHIAEELGHLGMMPRDPDTRLHAKLSGRKRIAWAEPLSLAEVKELAHQLEATVNDVLVASVAGALRRYLGEVDRYIKGNIHVTIPFNLRPKDVPIKSLGNQFGLVLVELPLDEPDPIKRFHKVKKALTDVKGSAQPKVTFGLLELLGLGPAALEKFALDQISDKSSLVMTNLPGPTSPMTIAGARILQPLVWVPQSGHLGVGLSIMSYAGTVQFGLITDASMIHEPRRVVGYFLDSFRELHGKAFGDQGK